MLARTSIHSDRLKVGAHIIDGVEADCGQIEQAIQLKRKELSLWRTDNDATNEVAGGIVDS